MITTIVELISENGNKGYMFKKDFESRFEYFKNFQYRYRYFENVWCYVFPVVFTMEEFLEMNFNAVEYAVVPVGKKEL